ncbi:Glyoxylase, beta-lactamase superfamily II [Faunimonas pinastri]|uniref:Glyoxylase, beta-lactamase superfamily II n=1 Tax=Faunimonas pinastri TaxID=1855383 RepID=A0A1H9Q0W6_9HYPH|nr:MBL fold metallo-hydrolase [Faunimonas pinastri]SER54074.1 Glyoxylase, beta-lactamase superfamily II [Faunimonas pinastri]
MKICDGIYLVASGGSGFDLSHDLDCNAWLMDAGDGLVLFDTGAGSEPGALAEAIRDDGLDPATLHTIFLTHAHADHSGGTVSLLRDAPAAQVTCGVRTAEILKAKDERLISLDRARGGYYPLDYAWEAPAVHRVLEADLSSRFGALEVTLIETPGHSADHCSFLVKDRGRTSLISGDALFAGGRIFLQEIEDCSVAQAIATVRKLAELPFETFLPGHGLFSLRNGSRHAQAGRQYADRNVPPPQL